jgi:hypothetical protein
LIWIDRSEADLGDVATRAVESALRDEWGRIVASLIRINADLLDFVKA